MEFEEHKRLLEIDQELLDMDKRTNPATIGAATVAPGSIRVATNTTAADGRRGGEAGSDTGHVGKEATEAGGGR